MLLSVVIPTYDRAELLADALDSLTNQTVEPTTFEVIVIDDGSPNKDTQLCCERFTDKLNVHYLRQDNSGIAAAKNLGVMAASNEIILFFDDDDLADPELLKEHLNVHFRHPEEQIAVLGRTNWAESLKVSPFMHYITDIGQFLFAYQGLRDGDILDYTYFWGGRTSCKRSLLMREGLFNQTFTFGCEDIELGFRLSRFGLKVIYNAQARSYMNRVVDYPSFLRRSERQGISQLHFARLHPEPEVQRYCQVEGARERWQAAEAGLQAKIDRVGELEKRVADNATSEQLEELHRLYGETITSMKLLGIVEAMGVERQRQAEEQEPVAARIKPTIADRRRLLAKHGQLLATYEPPHPDLAARAANRSQSKRILVIDPTLPAYDRSSGSRRLFETLRLLARQGHNVTFLAMSGEPGTRYQQELEREGVCFYPADPLRALALGFYAVGPPVDFEQLMRDGNFDLAILNFYYLADIYSEPIRRLSPHTKIVVDSVDVHWLREHREAELAGDEEKLRGAQRTKAREREVYSQADAVIAITEADREQILQLVPDAKTFVLPNIHEEPEGVAPASAGRDGLLFVGNFRHPPNIDAARFLGEHVLPELEAILGRPIPLRLVGGSAPPEVQALGKRPNIEVTGWVEDLEPYLRQARVSVAPVRYGAGLKGKIGEALAHGLPVVTTAIGAEGMQLAEENEVLLVGESAREIAEQIARLYRDDELWQRLSENGRRFVAEHYSPDTVHLELLGIVNDDVFAVSRFTPGLTSIVMLVRNQREVTEECIASLLRETDRPFELIVIDNGSSPATAEWLRQLTGNDERITLVRNNDNRGFGGGNNQGIALARGEFICLLNNDTVLTPRWLGELLDALEREPEVGLVGPVSNYVAGAQRVHNPPYSEGDLDGMLSFAARLRGEYHGQSVPSDRLVGFALLARRQVFDTVGGFDPLYQLGNFEDDDLTIRAAQAGFQARIVPSCFIHHYGNRTFAEVGVDWQAEMRRNWTLFQEKWGVSEDALAGEAFANPPADPLDASRLYSPLPLVGADHTPSNRLWLPGLQLQGRILTGSWRADWFGAGASLADTFATAVEGQEVRLHRWHSQQRHIGDFPVGVAYERKPSFYAPAKGAFILATSWDMSIAPSEWVEQIDSKIDQLWLPSQAAADAFLQAGIPEQVVRVIYPGVEGEVFTPEGEVMELPKRSEDTVVFLYVGELATRHGLDLLLAAWGEAFTAEDDVLLVIRPCPFGSYPGSPPVRVPDISGGAQIIEVDDESRKTLPSLYRAADVAVFPWRGAGDYPPLLEAAASGLPVIAPRAGLASELLGADYRWLQDSKPEAAGASEIKLDPRTQLQAIAVETLVTALRRALDPAERAATAEGMRERALAYSWESAAKAAADSLREAAARPPIRRLKPVTLEGANRQVFGLLDSPLDGGEGWKRAVIGWASAFRRMDDVTLAIASRDNRDDEVIELVVSALTAANIDLDEVADVTVVNLDGPVESLELACNAVIDSGSYKPVRQPLIAVDDLGL